VGLTQARPNYVQYIALNQHSEVIQIMNTVITDKKCLSEQQ